MKVRPRACSSRSKTPAWRRTQIGHVNAHGTSTPLNDAAEAEAIRKVFGDTPPPVTSTKGVTGHLIGAAGATEAVACVLAMREGLVPPTANLERLGDDIQLDVVHGAPRSVAPAPVAVELVRVRRSQRLADLRAFVVTATPIHAHADAAASASVRDVDGRQVMWFRIAGGKHHGAIGAAGGSTVERAVRLAGRARASRSSASSTRPAPSCASTSRRCTRGDSWHARSRSSRAPCRPARGHRRVRFRTGPRARPLRHRRDDRGRVRIRHRARRRHRVHRHPRHARGPRLLRGARDAEWRRDARRRRRARRPRRAARHPVVPPRSSPRRSARATRPTTRPIDAARSPRQRSPTAPTASYDVRDVIADIADDDAFARTARAARAEPRDRARAPRRPIRSASSPTSRSSAPARSTSTPRARRRVSLRGATTSTSRSSPSSTRRASSRAATSSGEA